MKDGVLQELVQETSSGHEIWIVGVRGGEILPGGLVPVRERPHRDRVLGRDKGASATVCRAKPVPSFGEISVEIVEPDIVPIHGLAWLAETFVVELTSSLDVDELDPGIITPCLRNDSLLNSLVDFIDQGIHNSATDERDLDCAKNHALGFFEEVVSTTIVPFRANRGEELGVASDIEPPIRLDLLFDDVDLRDKIRIDVVPVDLFGCEVQSAPTVLIPFAALQRVLVHALSLITVLSVSNLWGSSRRMWSSINLLLHFRNQNRSH